MHDTILMIDVIYLSSQWSASALVNGPQKATQDIENIFIYIFRFFLVFMPVGYQEMKSGYQTSLEKG